MIREAYEKDIDEIVELLRQVNQVHADGRPDLFKAGGVKYTKENLIDMMEMWHFEPAGRVLEHGVVRIYVYVKDKHVRGYIFCRYTFTEEFQNLKASREVYIEDLCVDEAMRGQGIGRELFEYACEMARVNACERMPLRVWECNPTAKAFYESMGMSPLYTGMEYKI